MSYKIEVVSEHISKLGESPYWNENNQKLSYCDCFEKEFCLLYPNTKISERYKLDIPALSTEFDFITAAIPYSNAKDAFLIVALNKLYKFNTTTKELKMVYEAESKKGTFNDGKCDPNGKLWLGWNVIEELGNLAEKDIHDQIENGNIQCFDGKYQMKVCDENYHLTNGLAWTMDYKQLFWADFLKKIIWAYDFDMENMILTSQNDELKDSGGFPDGLATDIAGNLWVACWEGGRVIKINTNTGQLMETIKMPVEKVTSLCFGGDNYKELYVTSACWGLQKVDTGVPNSGKIFRITTSSDNTFKGFPQNPFVEE